ASAAARRRATHSRTADDASRRGTDHGTGDRCLSGRSETVSRRQGSGQLHRDHSAGELQRRATAFGRTDQARQSAIALSVVRGGGTCGTPGSGTRSVLSAQISAEGFGKSPSRCSTKTRDSVVDHVARPDRLSRILSSWTDATEKRCCLCGDAWTALWCEKSPSD